MSMKLRDIKGPNGTELKSVGCGNYVCRYCGARPTQGNYVAGICLQLKAVHIGRCGAYVSNDKYSGYISECSTCQYYTKENGCTCEATEDPLA